MAFATVIPEFRISKYPGPRRCEDTRGASGFGSSRLSRFRPRATTIHLPAHSLLPRQGPCRLQAPEAHPDPADLQAGPAEALAGLLACLSPCSRILPRGREPGSGLPGHPVDRRVSHAHVTGDRPGAFAGAQALQGNPALLLSFGLRPMCTPRATAALRPSLARLWMRSSHLRLAPTGTPSGSDARSPAPRSRGPPPGVLGH